MTDEPIGVEAQFLVDQFLKGLDRYVKGLNEAERETKKTSDTVGKHGDAFATASSKAGIFGNALSKIGGVFLDVGKIAAGFVIGQIVERALSGLANLIPDLISKASNLNETVSKTNVIFGESAASVQEFAKDAATSIGQSEQAALDSAATFGVFGKAAGLTGQELADFSTEFTVLASDLASFNNTTPEEATLALGAALRGESEPLRRFGVLLNDAQLREKALELGLISTTKNALTPQQKILAAQALIYEQTADAQGDFERTSEGLANQQRILTAQLDNAKTVIGSALLPVVAQLANLLTGFLSSPIIQTGLKAITDGIAGISEKAQKFIEVMTAGGDPLENFQAAILAVFGPDALRNVQAFLKPIQENLPQAVAALSNLWTTALQPALAAVWDFISTNVLPILGQLWTWLWENLPGAINGLTTFLTGTLIPAFSAVWDFLQVNVVPILQTLFEWISKNLPPAIQALSDFWNNTLFPALEKIWQFLTVDMMPVWEALGELLEVTLGRSIESLTALWENRLQPALAAIWKFIQEKIIPIFDGWIKSLGGVKGIIESIVGWIEDLTEKIKNMKLPKWLTPGSPTPFELGLRGIQEALKEINRTGLPDFNPQLATAGAGAPGPGMGGMATRSTLPMATRAVTTNNTVNNSITLGGVTLMNGLDLAQLQGMLNQLQRRRS